MSLKLKEKDYEKCGHFEHFLDPFCLVYSTSMLFYVLWPLHLWAPLVTSSSTFRQCVYFLLFAHNGPCCLHCKLYIILTVMLGHQSTFTTSALLTSWFCFLLFGWVWPSCIFFFCAFLSFSSPPPLFCVLTASWGSSSLLRYPSIVSCIQAADEAHGVPLISFVSKLAGGFPLNRTSNPYIDQCVLCIFGHVLGYLVGTVSLKFMSYICAKFSM